MMIYHYFAAIKVLSTAMLSTTFYKFLRDLASSDAALDNRLMRLAIEAYLKNSPLDDDPSSNVFVMRLETPDVVYISEQARTDGLDLEKIYEEGQAYFDRLQFPEEIKVRREQIEPLLIKTVKSIQPGDLVNWTFACDFRMRLPSGEVKKYLQKFMVVPNAQNLPAFIFVRVLDVTDYYTNGKITFVATRVGDDKKENSVHEFFPANDLNITPRELEILGYVQQGMSSKEIADRLSLSVHTVNNHRQHILEKTGCRNTTEAIERAKNYH